MTTIDLAVLSSVTGGAAATPNVGDDMAHSVDVFADRLRRTSGKNLHRYNMCEYKASNDMGSGDPARVARGEAANCDSILAPARKR